MVDTPKNAETYCTNVPDGQAVGDVLLKPSAEHLFAAATWVPVDEPCLDPEGLLPHVTHNGVLRVGEVELHCYQLSDGRRVFDKDDVDALFGGTEAEAKTLLVPICTWVDAGIRFRAMRLRGPAVRVQFQATPGESWFGMFDALLLPEGDLKLTDWNSFDAAVDAEQGRIVGRAQLEIEKALA